MTGPSSSTRAATASYTLTVSEDPRLVATVRDVTAKTADIVGVQAASAARLADAVEQVAAALAERAGPGALRLFEIRFTVDPDALRVELVCDATISSRPASGAAADWTLERWLRECGALDQLRAIAPDAELSVAGSPCACRFTCPYASAD